MSLSPRVYDLIRATALVTLPLLAAILLGVFDYDTTAMVLMIIDALLGVWVLFTSRMHRLNGKNDYDGYVTSEGADELSGNPDLKFVFTKDPKEFLAQGYIKLRVDLPTQQV